MRADLVLAGFGNVARRFVEILAAKKAVLGKEHDLEVRIVGIATGRHGSGFAGAGLDLARVLRARAAGERLFEAAQAADGVTSLIAHLSASSAPLRVLVETTPLTIAAGQPAITHVEAALDAGCHVVTANKGPAAFAYRRLRDRAGREGLSFLFEGAVMDGVPIFNLVRETMPAVAIEGFRGIVNSTTNHILTAMEDGEPFAAALARMQAEGIAEADPSLDVDGWDAAAKTAALANVLMHADLTPHDVERAGIGPGLAERAREARRAGRRLRLVAAAAALPGGSIAATVRPEALEEADLLAHVHGKANALVLRTDLLGEVAIHQLGGDLTMTAYALLSDLLTVRRRAANVRRTRESPPSGSRARPLR